MLTGNGGRFLPVFRNDPFVITAQAFENLYPKRSYEAFIVPELFDEEGNAVFGATIFPDDGSRPQIEISAETPLKHAIEIFAHELAHVATPEDMNHGEAWEEAFERIFREYNRIGEVLFGPTEQE